MSEEVLKRQALKNISGLMLVIVFLFVFCGITSAAPWLGSGDANNPYQIWDTCDVNKLGEETYSSHFILMADVNVTGASNSQEIGAVVDIIIGARLRDVRRAVQQVVGLTDIILAFR